VLLAVLLLAFLVVSQLEVLLEVPQQEVLLVVSQLEAVLPQEAVSQVVLPQVFL
jgi:hypothetical protein